MRVLVAGATGFLRRAVAEGLRETVRWLRETGQAPPARGREAPVGARGAA